MLIMDFAKFDCNKICRLLKNMLKNSIEIVVTVFDITIDKNMDLYKQKWFLL